jgi:DNA-binding beta-propeller fold protein YncE
MRIVFLLVLTLGFALTLGAEPAVTFISASTVEMENPHDIKLSADGKLLFVSDVGFNRILVLDPETLSYVGEFGSDHQQGTHDIDFDSRGAGYVADTRNNRVTIYRMDGAIGKLIAEIGEGIRGPEGVLAHSNGQIYVAGAWSGNVVAYKNGVPVAELTGLSSPHDLEINPDGNIWLSDAGNNRMLLLSPELEILKEWSGKPYEFNGVRYQDVLPDGTVITADKNSHTVKFIGADGELLLVLGSGKPEKGPGVFTTPEGVETLGDTLWISDSGNDRIEKYKVELVR